MKKKPAVKSKNTLAKSVPHAADTSFGEVLRLIQSARQRAYQAVNGELVTRLFTTPLERLGARRLSDAIRQTAGMPLLFDVTIADERADGTTASATDVYRAIAVENPPAAL